VKARVCYVFKEEMRGEERKKIYFDLIQIHYFLYFFPFSVVPKTAICRVKSHTTCLMVCQILLQQRMGLATLI
jgi:hypothetical protein